MRLIQLLGDGVEELWEFWDGTADEDIQKWYKEYEDQEEYDLFDEYLNSINVNADRVFVDEIYV